MARRDDPYGAYNFLVEIDGLTIAGFSECSGLGAETTVIEYREGSDKGGVRKLPGLTRFTNVTLKRGLSTSRELWQWHRSVVAGTVERRTCRIVVLDEAHAPVARYHLENAWPVKYEGPRLKATGNEVAIETLEIAHEGLGLE
jgi:phage tail-like protein